MIPLLKIGVTGGIGSGKSTVCRLFGMLGVPIYDSDRRAREIMSSDAEVIGTIKRAFGERSYRDGKVDRDYISALVFNDKGALHTLNRLVHPAVMRDFLHVAAELRKAAESGNSAAVYIILESAIIFENNLQDTLDYVITVSAPTELRMSRAMARDGAAKEKIEARMANQMTDSERGRLADFEISNDERSLVWEQVLELDGFFGREYASRQVAIEANEISEK